MKLNNAGFELIQRHEGLRLKAYLCPAGVWTIGYGHTGDVKEGQQITEHQADVILQYDLERFEAGVEKLLGDRKVNENQFAALVSLAFNIGLKAFGESTLLKRVRASRDHDARVEFAKWVRGGGKVLPGLVKRRAEEAALFATPVVRA